MVAPAIPPVPIDLRNYQPPNPPGAPPLALPPAPINGLATLNFEHRIIQDLTTAYPQVLHRLNAIAYCFSQALASPNEQFSPLVACSLKSNFLRLAKTHPMEAERVLAQDEFRNPQQNEIKDLIKRVSYYNSYSISKFLHHLRGGLGSTTTVSGKAFYAGLTLIFGGAAAQYVSEDENGQKIGIAGFATGGLLVATCVIHACRKVYKGEP